MRLVLKLPHKPLLPLNKHTPSCRKHYSPCLPEQSRYGASEMNRGRGRERMVNTFPLVMSIGKEPSQVLPPRYLHQQPLERMPAVLLPSLRLPLPGYGESLTIAIAQGSRPTPAAACSISRRSSRASACSGKGRVFLATFLVQARAQAKARRSSASATANARVC